MRGLCLDRLGALQSTTVLSTSRLSFIPTVIAAFPVAFAARRIFVDIFGNIVQIASHMGSVDGNGAFFLGLTLSSPLVLSFWHRNGVENPMPLLPRSLFSPRREALSLMKPFLGFFHVGGTHVSKYGCAPSVAVLPVYDTRHLFACLEPQFCYQFASHRVAGLKTTVSGV